MLYSNTYNAKVVKKSMSSNAIHIIRTLKKCIRFEDVPHPPYSSTLAMPDIWLLAAQQETCHRNSFHMSWKSSSCCGEKNFENSLRSSKSTGFKNLFSTGGTAWEWVWDNGHGKWRRETKYLFSAIVCVLFLFNTLSGRKHTNTDTLLSKHSSHNFVQLWGGRGAG